MKLPTKVKTYVHYNDRKDVTQAVTTWPLSSIFITPRYVVTFEADTNWQVGKA
jgi:hypothetical protein